MLEHILLQMFLSLVPVFAFQIWYDRPGRRKGIPVFLALFSILTLILCAHFSKDIEYGLGVDNRSIPYVIGALYGGPAGTVLLTVMYAALWTPQLTGFGDALEMTIFTVLLIPMLMFGRRRFEQHDRTTRLRAIAAVSFMIFLKIASVILLEHVFYTGFTAAAVMTTVLHTAGSAALLWAAILLIEGTIEKQRMHHRLTVVSQDYRNEVQKLQQFIDLTPLGVIIVDQAGTITHINEQAVRYISEDPASHGRASLIGGMVGDMDFREEASPVRGLLLEVLEGRTLAPDITREEQRVLVRTAFNIRDDVSRDIIGAAVIIHDITEVSHLKDEITRVERLSLVGQMAASITHEIRNPMAVIRGFVQLMQERSAEGQHEYYRIIMDELDRANSIINDFLSLAQNRVIEKESQSLHDVLNMLSPLLWADANLRGQVIELDLCSDMPPMEMNEKEIKQLILNLARNGMEAMDEKGKLVIRTGCTDDTVELYVEDNGAGIPADQLERLFEPFYTTKSRGTGLGLPLCLSIAERHSGSIRVESEEGKGTTFIVTFRREAGSDPIPQQAG
ncbi:ATP-binding protein [Paenibacillus tarimensis]|uniref:ATP-binding protein n=2 Tax=Paenibacillus tarimensis TaxID=416012 RepID=UPI001F405C57|nr:ATP-binding protein [Paenibacillus tarimensis]MCF2945952.1 ATP-binding protein [Paenibacillus tarimensis]